MKPVPSFLDDLKAAADRSATAEQELRREVAERMRTIEHERAFAFRRLNLMRALAEVVAGAEGEEIAVAAAAGVLRAKLGWSDASEARDAVVSQFAPIARAMYACLSPDDEKAVPQEIEAPEPDVLAELAAFERWYAETHPKPFWVLFEAYMQETPVVDF
jgi:hypothetical protein